MSGNRRALWWNYAKQRRDDAAAETQTLADDGVHVRQMLEDAYAGNWIAQFRPRLNELLLQRIHDGGLARKMEKYDVQGVASGVAAAEHKGLRFLEHAARGGDAARLLLLGGHERVEDGAVLRLGRRGADDLRNLGTRDLLQVDEACGQRAQLLGQRGRTVDDGVLEGREVAERGKDLDGLVHGDDDGRCKVGRAHRVDGDAEAELRYHVDGAAPEGALDVDGLPVVAARLEDVAQGFDFGLDELFGLGGRLEGEEAREDIFALFGGLVVEVAERGPVFAEAVVERALLVPLVGVVVDVVVRLGAGEMQLHQRSALSEQFHCRRLMKEMHLVWSDAHDVSCMCVTIVSDSHTRFGVTKTTDRASDATCAARDGMIGRKLDAQTLANRLTAQQLADPGSWRADARRGWWLHAIRRKPEPGDWPPVRPSGKPSPWQRIRGQQRFHVRDLREGKRAASKKSSWKERGASHGSQARNAALFRRS